MGAYESTTVVTDTGTYEVVGLITLLRGHGGTVYDEVEDIGVRPEGSENYYDEPSEHGLDYDDMRALLLESYKDRVY